jgi:hypothetical protein
MISSPERRIGAVWGGYAVDAAQLVALVACIPVAILAIGTPFALAVRLLLEIARKLFGR